MVFFPETHAEYAQARERLLERIAAGLAADRRFMAAWLSGSYGRGEQDAVSDIDLSEAKTGKSRELGNSRGLQTGIIIGIAIIEPGHSVALG